MFFVFYIVSFIYNIIMNSKQNSNPNHWKQKKKAYNKLYPDSSHDSSPDSSHDSSHCNGSKQKHTQQEVRQPIDEPLQELRVFDVVDRSIKIVYMDRLYKNIETFNLYTISQLTVETLCNYLKINDLKKQSNILGAILCITKMYHQNKKITEDDIFDPEVKELFTKSIVLMKKLSIIDDKETLNVMNKHSNPSNPSNPSNTKSTGYKHKPTNQYESCFKRHISLLLTHLNFRINVKRNRQDMHLLIVIYFSIADLYLNMKPKNNTKQNQSHQQSNPSNTDGQHHTNKKITNVSKHDFMNVWKELKNM